MSIISTTIVITTRAVWTCDERKTVFLLDTIFHPAVMGAELFDVDAVLLVVCTMFVLMMTLPGLALFYGSLVSRKNLLDTMLQSVVLTCTVSVLWWICAYSLCFDRSVTFFSGGFGRSFLFFGSQDTYNEVPEAVWCAFQLTFAIITPAIVGGAVVERALFWPLMLFCNVWFLVVYCPICHMVWGDGVLQQWGVVDTAGGLVVETCSGFSALVLCYFIGPRRITPEPPDSVRAVLHIVGASLLWVGWLGFNAGSAFPRTGRVAMTLLNTQLSGCAGAIFWMLCAMASKSKKGGMPSAPATFHLMGGAIAGLCAATPSSGYVTPSASVLIGGTAGMLCFAAETFLMGKVLHPKGIDDVVAVFPVHGVAGALGTLLTGVFATRDVGGIEGGWHQFGKQVLGLLVVVGWSVVATAVIAGTMKKTKWLRRATLEEETHGASGEVDSTFSSRFDSFLH
eukprot:TRINITY_DN2088_c0_g1_i1.p1 TRINITY_DN2088_c0_g1~~TRINITY_DN2088_c0_g1_i1.p1  ORF type:complete len:453 (+),score=58.61 TRINITY_DN2088_c0_g1_i1:443-1801(+)